MIAVMIVMFVVGYFCIAMEHPFKVNKAASALLLCALLWTVYIFAAPELLACVDAFKQFQVENSSLNFHEQVIKFVTSVQIIEHLGDTSQILFFLLGAMTIVELVDMHGGFSIITDRITTKNKRALLWILAFVTFFLSALLDNMTTAIVMVMLLRKLIKDQADRWLFASMIIIAANSGGAWSPIGDVTTIMLWVGGQVSTTAIIPSIILPSLVSVVVPLLVVTFSLKGEVEPNSAIQKDSNHFNLAEKINNRERISIFCLGVGALIFVPIFKSITHLPPFLGILLGLGVLWVYTELLYHKKKDINEKDKGRISNVLSRIDMSTLLFFLGILMAVGVLQCAGILTDFADILDKEIGNIYIINLIIGILSSIVDNVPLVAAAMGMYPLDVYPQDSIFWTMLAYCAGVGGSILIIGSAAGVVVMGIEKINFIWYLKKISWLALLGYLCGAGAFYLQTLLLGA
jgi:Na+/H+ antiporter NhaD/arsenite permease-like protein